MKEVILKNPITLWLRWIATWVNYQFKYRGRHLRLEYLTEVTRCEFAEYNTIHKYARIRDCRFGKCSYVGRESQVYSAKVGAFTSIGPQVLIGLGEHPTDNFVSTHPMFYSTRGQSNPVIVDRDLFDEFPNTHIGSDVWIGARAIIRTGVNIGHGAIVAAGAVVVRDVEPYSIVGGVPAKHIRFRFDEEQRKHLLALKWWDKDLKWMIKNKEKFTRIDRMMD